MCYLFNWIVQDRMQVLSPGQPLSRRRPIGTWAFHGILQWLLHRYMMESTISQKPLGREKYVAEVIVFLTYYFAFERKNMELKQFSCLRQLPFSEHTGLSLKPQTPINRNWPINLLDAGKRKGKLQGRFAYARPPTGCQDWELSRQASPPLRSPTSSRWSRPLCSRISHLSCW